MTPDELLAACELGKRAGQLVRFTESYVCNQQPRERERHEMRGWRMAIIDPDFGDGYVFYRYLTPTDGGHGMARACHLEEVSDG